MRHSERSSEGYILIDHRYSPGIEQNENNSKYDTPFVAGGATYESATYRCPHCHSIVIIKPDRTRERARCFTCGNKRICDGCALIPYCRPFDKLLDQLQTAAYQEEQKSKATIPAPTVILTDIK